MSQEQYIHDIMRYIRLPKATKARLREDLESDVQARLEAGIPLEEIAAELGEPKEAAKQLAASLPPEYKTPHRWVRYVYMVCGVVPFVVGAVILVRLSLSYQDQTGLYANFAEYFPTVLQNHYRIILLLFFNAFMQLAVCIMGFLLFRQKWQPGDRRLLVMLGACAFLWFFQQPAVLGIPLLPVSTYATLLWTGPFQPQCVLTLITGVCLYMAHKKGRG